MPVQHIDLEEVTMLEVGDDVLEQSGLEGVLYSPSKDPFPC